MTATIKKFGYPATLVKDFTKWVLLLRPQQATLGSVVKATSLTPAGVGRLCLRVPPWDWRATRKRDS